MLSSSAFDFGLPCVPFVTNQTLASGIPCMPSVTNQTLASGTQNNGNSENKHFEFILACDYN